MGTSGWQSVRRNYLSLVSPVLPTTDRIALARLTHGQTRTSQCIRMDRRRSAVGRLRTSQGEKRTRVHGGQNERCRVGEQICWPGKAGVVLTEDCESACVTARMAGFSTRFGCHCSAFEGGQIDWDRCRAVRRFPDELHNLLKTRLLIPSMTCYRHSDFHGRVHKTMAKQLAKALEPHQPLFIEEPLLPGHVPEMEKLYQKTSIPIAVSDNVLHQINLR
jgi:hypothetical protein